MPRIALPAAALAAAVATSGCVTYSLHSPRPLAEDESSVGLHVGTFASVRDDVDVGGLTGHFTGRFGLGHRVEVGANVGSTGVDGAAKLGFLDGESPLQVSGIAGLGLFFYQLFQANVGVLLGYTFGDVVTPYVGARGFLLFADGPGAFYNVIGGLDIQVGGGFGLMFEAVLAPGDIEDIGGVLALSGGVTYAF